METLILFVVTVIAWFAVEFYLLFAHKPTISTRIIELYTRWPTLGLLVGLVTGLLLGHWFWRT
jgi:hypothetical protein